MSTEAPYTHFPFTTLLIWNQALNPKKTFNLQSCNTNLDIQIGK
jgi:hypothetical protein